MAVGARKVPVEMFVDTWFVINAEAEVIPVDTRSVPVDTTVLIKFVFVMFVAKRLDIVLFVTVIPVDNARDEADKFVANRLDVVNEGIEAESAFKSPDTPRPPPTTRAPVDNPVLGSVESITTLSPKIAFPAIDDPPMTSKDPPSVIEVEAFVENMLRPPYTMTLASLDVAGLVSKISMGVTYVLASILLSK
jgi:hypothetical protein